MQKFASLTTVSRSVARLPAFKSHQATPASLIAQRRNYSLFGKLKDLVTPNLQGHVPEKYVVNFEEPGKGLDTLLTRCDEDLGGFSTVHLDELTESQPPTKFARFHGEISLDLPEDKPDIVRLGYAMFRTKDLPTTIFGAPTFWDWSEYSQISLRVRGDHRKYFINIQADTPSPTDLYQHRLFLKTPGEWETVTVNLKSFILTLGGVIQHQVGLDTAAIRSVGIGLVDGNFGPYQLDIAWIKAHNGEEIYDDFAADPIETAHMRGEIAEGSPLGTIPAPERDGPVDERKVPESKTPGKRLSVDD